MEEVNKLRYKKTILINFFVVFMILSVSFVSNAEIKTIKAGSKKTAYTYQCTCSESKIYAKNPDSPFCTILNNFIKTIEGIIGNFREAGFSYTADALESKLLSFRITYEWLCS